MDDSEFLEDYDPAAYERLSITVDLVLLGLHRGRLAVLLSKRGEPPQAGRWSLPGGFVGLDESLDEAAARLLRIKAGLPDAYLEQLYTFGRVDRDPRMRIVTVAYLALLDPHTFAGALRGPLVPATLEGEPLRICGPDGEPLDLAFDHQDILALARSRLRGKIDYSDVGFALLPDPFTLRDLQTVHEAVLGQKLNKPAFRRRMLDRGWLMPTGTREADASHRPAALFRRAASVPAR